MNKFVQECLAEYDRRKVSGYFDEDDKTEEQLVAFESIDELLEYEEDGWKFDKAQDILIVYRDGKVMSSLHIGRIGWSGIQDHLNVVLGFVCMLMWVEYDEEKIK